MTSEKLPAAPQIVRRARAAMSPIIPGLTQLSWHNATDWSKEDIIKNAIWDLLLVARGAGFDPQLILNKVETYLDEEQEELFKDVSPKVDDLLSGKLNKNTKKLNEWSVAHWSAFVSALPSTIKNEHADVVSFLLGNSLAGRRVLPWWGIIRGSIESEIAVENSRK